MSEWVKCDKGNGDHSYRAVDGHCGWCSNMEAGLAKEVRIAALEAQCREGQILLGQAWGNMWGPPEWRHLVEAYLGPAPTALETRLDPDDAPINLDGFDKPGAVFKIGGKVVSRDEGLEAFRKRFALETKGEQGG